MFLLNFKLLAIMKKIFWTLFVFFILSIVTMKAQTTYCLGYDVVSISATQFTVQLKLQGSSSFKLGSHNLRFNYNSAALSAPALVAIAPANSDLNTILYNPINITTASTTSQRFNGLLSTLNTGVTIAASPTWSKLGQVTFTITDPSQTSAISFNPSLSIVRLDDGLTSLTVGPSCPLLNVALPLEIVSFDATKVKNKTLLAWSTTNAFQMSHFEVERSQDGKTFVNIGRVDIANTADLMSYKLTDEKPFVGINYYRLKSVEKSGRADYSKIVSVSFGTDLMVSAFPNPFQDVLMLNVESEYIGSDMTFELINALGAQVAFQQQEAIGGNLSVTFNTHDLMAGVYIVRIKVADKVWQDKFVKE
jgi:Secretion system C-terminal sorting domain